jgi:flagellar motility protein MotE (MotC chaperone)
VITRQAKRRFRIGAAIRKVLLPVAALGALAGAVMWPPSHKIIFDGPLKPWIAKAQPLAEQAARPLHFVAQQQTITEKNREIQQLDAQLEQNRKDLSSRDDQIKALQGQLNGARAAANASTPAPAAAGPGAVAAAAAAPAAGGGAPTQPDPDVKRTASIWSQMDAEAVAGLIQKLPTEYVVRVLAQMSPDEVGQVMEALPPQVAAKITQTQPPAP